MRADADACAVREVVASFRPDLAILDVRLPVGPDGCATARVLQDAADVAVLFLTAADSIEDRLAGFHCGCDDYLVKPFSMAELQVRIRALLRRMGRGGPSLRRAGDITLDEASHVVTRAGQEVELTKKEFELLATFLARPGQVISKLQLLAEVWRFEGFDENLVEVNVSSLRADRTCSRFTDILSPYLEPPPRRGRGASRRRGRQRGSCSSLIMSWKRPHRASSGPAEICIIRSGVRGVRVEPLLVVNLPRRRGLDRRIG